MCSPTHPHSFIIAANSRGVRVNIKNVLFSVLLALASMPVSATLITAGTDFDSLNEGFYGSSFTDGGITFFDQQPFPTFAVDELGYSATELGPTFSPSNYLNFGGFLAPGPECCIFGGFQSMRMSFDGEASSASLDVYTFINVSSSNTLALEAYLDGTLVAIDSALIASFDETFIFPHPFDFTLGHRRFAVSDGRFDELRLVASGPAELIFPGVDNVRVPEPGVLELVIVSGVFVLLGWAKRLLRYLGSRVKNIGFTFYILFSAVFMLATGTGSLAQDAITGDDANEQSPVCLTHMISDATGECRNAFMQAFSTLSRKCGKGKTLNEADIRHMNEYMSACGCSNECRQ